MIGRLLNRGAGLESSEDPRTHVSSRVAHVGYVLSEGAVIIHCYGVACGSVQDIVMTISE